MIGRAISNNLFKIGVMLSLASLPVFATVVDYSTTGVFNISCPTCVSITGNGTNDVTLNYAAGTATLSFTGVPAGTVTSDGSFVTAGYGKIMASTTGTGGTIAGSFVLSVNQSAPNMPPTSGSFTATLSGLVFDSASTSYASFGASADPEIVLGGPVTYELDTSKDLNNPSQYGVTIVSPDTNGGVTSLQGNVAAPEPAFLTLTGAGFAALSAFAIRRRRRGTGV